MESKIMINKVTMLASNSFAKAMILGIAATTTGITFAATPADAANLSFTENLANPNQTRSFAFTADGTSTVTIRSYSYGGGTNAAGATIAAVGFDPNLTLFDAAGNWYDERDDDVLLDFRFIGVLPAGNYQAVVAAFGNNSAGFGNLSTPFNGQGTFDVLDPITGNITTRTSAFAFDILNVSPLNPTAVPEPASLIGTAIAGIAAIRLKRKLSARKN
jgi:hypothetical protein